MRLIAVLPCYALDEIAKNLDEAACREFHASWTALWHPRLLQFSPALPEWKRSDESSLDLEKAIIVAPESAASSVDVPMVERLELNGCRVIFASEERKDVLALLAERLGLPLDQTPAHLLLPTTDDATSLDLFGQPKLEVTVDDFYALGMALLFVQALTRKVHYSSNLDLVIMADQARSAAEAYLNGDAVEAERWLQSCFDQLSQERDRYFNQAAYLIDLTLLANSTLGGSLEAQLQQSHPANFMASASIMRQWKETRPALWQQLEGRLANQTACIVGGLDQERLHPWKPLGTLQRDLIDGRKAYEQLGLSAPRVFSRFGAGMSIEMPTHLKAAGYSGAILHAFSEGQYPVTSQAKISWEASDTTHIDTLSSAIIDAHAYRSVFNAINELAKQFDHHQVPTLVGTHWPSRTCQAFDDLIRASRRTNAFGQWVTLENYFETTGYVYSHQSFTAADFKFPLPSDYDTFSKQAQALQKLLQRNAQLESIRNMAQLALQIQLVSKKSHEEVATWRVELAAIEALLRASDGLSDEPMDIQSARHPELMNEIELHRQRVSEQLRSLTTKKSTNTSAATPGYLVVNPFSGPRRCILRDVPGTFIKTESNRIYESLAVDGKSDVIVDVPPMGMVQLQPAASSGILSSGGSRRIGPKLASPSLLLANEFLECQVDPDKGYLRSIMLARKRGGRLSGMPAIVVADAHGKSAARYSVIREAQSQIVENSPLHGVIESRGELIIDDRPAAKFTLRYSLWRGSRSLELDLKLEYLLSREYDENNVWQGSPVWRTAWPSQAANLTTWVQGTRSRLRTSRIFAPDLIEIDDAEHKIFLAFRGLPLHRRVEASYLDTLLGNDSIGIVHHAWQIGVDWPRPYQSYLESLDTHWLLADGGGSLPAGSSVWFAQTNQPNARIELVGGDEKTRFLLHETHGKEGRVKISFFRDAAAADRVSVDGSSIEALDVEKGQIMVDIKPCEISYVDVAWA